MGMLFKDSADPILKLNIVTHILDTPIYSA